MYVFIFVKSTLARADLEFEWSIMKSLLFFIISGNYHYIFHTIKICRKIYIYIYIFITINLIEQSKFKSLIKIKV
jgi:DMSO/TMAO reductase YedYZ heme-binding membrane subunit